MSNYKIRNKHAFIDEFGNSDLRIDKEGVTEKYIICATLFDRSGINEELSKLLEIKRKFFQTGEMKSSKVGNNHKRRLRILKELRNVDYKVYAYVINKNLLYSEGLKRKKVFYKFLNGQLDKDLFSTFPDLKITADNIGRDEYMKSFKEYIKNRHMPDLFDEMEFGFATSPDNVFIQLSDFIAGTLARNFDKTTYCEQSKNFMEQLAGKIVNIVEWPKSNMHIIEKDSTDYGDYDDIIKETSIHAAEHYIEINNETKDKDTMLRIMTLKYLLLNFKYIDPNRSITADEIIESLSEYIKNSINKQYFMQNIIAKLRDKGIIISSGSYGYKIPGNWIDIDDYLSHSQSIIVPILNRVKKAREKIYLASLGEFDIIEKKPILLSLLGNIENKNNST